MEKAVAKCDSLYFMGQSLSSHTYADMLLGLSLLARGKEWQEQKQSADYVAGNNTKNAGYRILHPHTPVQRNHHVDDWEY